MLITVDFFFIFFSQFNIRAACFLELKRHIREIIRQREEFFLKDCRTCLVLSCGRQTEFLELIIAIVGALLIEIMELT